MGQKPYKRTDEHLEQVKGMILAGATCDIMGRVLGIDEGTVRKHYAHELDTYAAQVDGQLAQTAVNRALAGDPAMLIFLCKVRMGWKETSKLEIDAKLNQEVAVVVKTLMKEYTTEEIKHVLEVMEPIEESMANVTTIEHM